jgi:hypothetical protein
MLPDSKKFLDLLEKSKYKSLDQLFTDFKKQSKLPDDFVALIDSPRIAGILDNYFRSLWLRTSFKLDPVLIEKINDKYGWLDWRTPEAQAVYWATMGLISQIKGMSLEAAKIAYWKDPIQGRDLACERMITQALKESFASGKILWVDRENYQNIIMVPNLKVVDAVNKVFEEAYKNNPGVESFRSARLNFIQEAIMLLFNFGNFTKAAEYYKMLQREEPGSHRKSLEAFVMEQWAEEVRTASVKRATEVISGLIYRSCYFLAYGDDDAALASEKMARYIYNTYQLQNSDIKERVGLAAYKEIKKAVVTNCIKSLPPVLGEVLKARLQEDVLKKKEEDKEAAEKKK